LAQALNGQMTAYTSDLLWAASEMTYIVSGGALNSTHSLTPSGFHIWTKKDLILF